MGRLRFVAPLAAAVLVMGLAGLGLAWGEDDPPASDVVPIGAQVADLEFTDTWYLPRNLSALGKGKDVKAYVVMFTTTKCPLVRRYLPRFAELHERYEKQGVAFLALNVGVEDSVVDIAAQAHEVGAAFPFGKDFDGTFARALGVTRTPEVVVLDAERRIRYRGRVDDQVRLGGIKPAVGRSDLAEAIADVLAATDVRVAETPVDGCAISPPAVVAPDPTLTYARDIAPIVQDNCESCHREGGMAPFALSSFEDVRDLSEMIVEVVAQGRMPPWFASSQHTFANQPSLTAEQRDKLIAWVKGGTPRGDAKDLPAPRKWPGPEWEIGEPDLVIQAPDPITIQKDGYMPYQHVMLPHTFTEDTWISALEIKPTTPEVLHHCNIVYIMPRVDPRKFHFITGKVPGGGPMMLDDGTAFCIPKGAVLVMQAHYAPIGRETTDRLSVGLRFPRTEVKRSLKHLRINDQSFAIPPGAPNHAVTASLTLPADAIGEGMFSHMHLRGKDMSFEAVYPDGKKESLLVIPNYSFDWQLAYVWKPGEKRFPKGTRIEVTAHYDNSPWNPYNPDPSKTVRDGPQTYHEMMYGFFFYTEEHEDLGLRVDPKTGAPLPAGEPAPAPAAPAKRPVY